MRHALFATVITFCLALVAQAQVLVYTGTLTGTLYGQGRTEKISEKLYLVISYEGDGAALISYGKDDEGKWQDDDYFTFAKMPFQPFDVEPWTLAHREVLGPKNTRYAEVAFRGDEEDEFEPFSFAAYVTGSVGAKPVDIGFPLGPAATVTATIAKSFSGFAVVCERDAEEISSAVMADDDDDDDEIDPMLTTGLLAVRLKFDQKTTKLVNSSEEIGGMLEDAVQYLQTKLESAGYPQDFGDDDDDGP
jgi:hypothetical protein